MTRFNCFFPQSSGCPKCLNPSCHHGEVCVNLPKVAVYPGFLPKYLRLLRLNQLKALRKLRCPDCEKFYDLKDLKDFKDSFYYDAYDLKKCGIKDLDLDYSGSVETVEVSSEECSSGSSSSSEESSEEDITYKVCRKCGHHKLCTCGGNHDHGHRRHGRKFCQCKKTCKCSV